MMKNLDRYAVAGRKPAHEIEVMTDEYKSLGSRYAVLGLPIIRGVVNFGESLYLGLKTLSYSSSFYEEEDYEPGCVIWFGKNGEPYECRVTGLRVTADSLTVLAEEKESGDEVQCHSPFELGAKNIDWLHEMYEAVWHQLRETNNVESQIEEP